MESATKSGFSVIRALKGLKSPASRPRPGHRSAEPLFPEPPARAAAKRPVPIPNDPSAAFASAFKLVTEAKGGTQVLVMSLPRTGSKYLQGVLAAAYGIASGRPPVVLTGPVASLIGKGYMINPGHTHGVDDARLEEMLLHGVTDGKSAEDVWRKAHILVRLRAGLRRARRRVVFTITRPSRDRIVSAFVLQKAGRVDFDDRVSLAEIWRRFEKREMAEEQAWWDDNIRGELGVPAAVVERARAGIEPYVVHADPRLVHVFVSLKRLDAMLEERLFPIVPADRLRARTAELRLRFGLGSTNSSESRGLAEAKAKLLDAIAGQS